MVTGNNTVEYRNKGRECYKRGIRIEQNPYRGGTWKRRAWHDGWWDAHFSDPNSKVTPEERKIIVESSYR